MVVLQRASDEKHVTFVTREPLVYLDPWALCRIARQDTFSRRVLKALDRHGTLMFSWANAAEIVDHPDYSRWPLRKFLEAVNEHWFPLEVLPEAVRAREDGSGENSPCFDEELVKQYAPQVGSGEAFTLAKFVALADDDRNAARDDLAACKAEFVQQLTDQRTREQSEPGHAARAFPSEPLDPRRPVRFVLNSVYREIIGSHNWKVTEHDAIPLLHAIVASAYCDLVVLDPDLCKRADTWPRPRYRAQFYSEPTFEKFLNELERLVKQKA